MIIKRILDVVAWLVVASFFIAAIILIGTALWYSKEAKVMMAVFGVLALLFWSLGRITNGD